MVSINPEEIDLVDVKNKIMKPIEYTIGQGNKRITF
jgi:hypothetical protein